ncbi:MAG: hypothetical protein M0P73_16310 [Syntrophobacterales bacterium]|jgi:hypothetical protein|nr:hypothetical protein [Syntrophobacterales bacterium]
MRVIKDRNAGNSSNTYWKGTADREFCIELQVSIYGSRVGEYARDSAGRVRRFATRQAAERAMALLGWAEASAQVQQAPQEAP